MNRQKPQPFETPLSTSLLDIEAKTRGNTFSWRGQFSPQLIDALINAYCQADDVIFDPFGGSGTVLNESARKGHEAHITEINPAAWMLSRIYELSTVPKSTKVKALKSIRDNFLSELTKGSPSGDYEINPEDIQRIAGRLSKSGNAQESIILSAAVVMLDIHNKKPTASRLAKVIDELETKCMSLPPAHKPIKAHLSDARRTPFEQNTFDFVITSPPYINVFNYHQNYRASVELLGWDLLKVAKSEIGSNRANRGNRFKTVVQYCIDICAVLEELHRVCKPSAKIILVVGRESSVLGVSWKNSALVKEIAEQSGQFDCVLIQERKFKNMFGQTIYEDLLHLTPVMSAKCNSTKAKEIALQSIRSAIETSVSKNKGLLRQIIETESEIKGIPLFSPQDHPLSK
jgi:DNA modification methylase